MSNEAIYHSVIKPEVQEVVARVVSEEKLSLEQTKELAEAVKTMAAASQRGVGVGGS